MATARQLARHLECCICMDIYSQDEQVAKILLCGHTFCAKCLVRLITRMGTIQCANCKKFTDLPPSGVKGLVTNYGLMGMLEYVNEQSGQQHLPYSSRSHQTSSASPYEYSVESPVYRTPSAPPCDYRVNYPTSQYLDLASLPDIEPGSASRPPCPCSYNVKPRLIFGSFGSSHGQLQCPKAVDVIDDLLYIADCYNKRICVYNINGKHISSQSLDYKPFDLVITPDNDIIISHCSEHKILIYDQSGSIKEEIRGHQIMQMADTRCEFNYPSGVAMDSDGMIYVCDYHNNKVQVMKYSANGMNFIDNSKELRRSIRYPDYVAIHPQTGCIYVSSSYMHKVFIFNQKGHYRSSITKTNIPGIDRFTPSNLSFSEDGRLCISDLTSHCLYILKDEILIQKIGGEGSDPGQFRFPRGTAFTNTGDLVVCDGSNHRIQVFST